MKDLISTRSRTKYFGQFPGKFLSRKSNEVGARYHCNVVQGKDPDMSFRMGIADSNRNRDEGPQNIDCHGEFACGACGDADEMMRMNTLSAALTMRVNSFRDLVSVVVESWGMMFVLNAIFFGLVYIGKLDVLTSSVPRRPSFFLASTKHVSSHGQRPVRRIDASIPNVYVFPDRT